MNATYATIHYTTPAGTTGRQTIRFAERWEGRVRAIESRGSKVTRVTVTDGRTTRVVLERKS